jgi:hypothetical protein
MSWDRLGGRAQQREQARLLSAWIEHEVRPFSVHWGNRLAGLAIRSVEDLRQIEVSTDVQLAGAGGPGNPDLPVLPTEDGFKRHASRAELVAASREVGKGGAEGRRAALFRRYKPVHIHEAGVAHLLAVAYTRSDLDRLHLAGARLMEVLGLGADDSMVSAVPQGPSVRFWGLYHAALAARMTALHPRGAGEAALRPVLRGLAMLPATVLAVPVGEAGDLLEGLSRRGARLDGLRTLLTVGPPPSQPLRVGLAESAARLAGNPVRVQAVWAPETSRTLWGECRPTSADPLEATYGLHTYPDLELVEVRDVATATVAEEGVDGELVLTSMGWRGTALVRAATGSWTEGLSVSAPCPSCGRTVPRLAPAAADAAWQPRVRTTEGRFVRPDLRQCYRVLTPDTLSRLRIADWALRGESERLVFAVDAPPERDLLWELARKVGEAVGAEVQLRVDPRLAAARPQVGSAGAAE